MKVENRIQYDKAIQLEQMAEKMLDFCFVQENGILNYEGSEKYDFLTEKEAELFEELLGKIKENSFTARNSFDLKTLSSLKAESKLNTILEIRFSGQIFFDKKQSIKAWCTETGMKQEEALRLMETGSISVLVRKIRNLAVIHTKREILSYKIDNFIYGFKFE
jgi:hypothetical protein